MTLDTLLQGNPAYDDALAEAVLQHYLRFKHATIARLQSMGMDADDVEQELRLALWKAWSGWNGQIALRRWLSWKLDYRLRDMERNCAKQLQRLKIVYLEDISHPESTD
jgi:DNA-directed RNA polymerase specialized sigma24 family protein